MQEQASERGLSGKRPRRKRTGKKRVVFQVPPKPAPSVRELWRQASEEQQQKAHVTCASVLEYWLGKATKYELAERLGVPPLRVWQLSQMAVSGMLAGLLKQPRGRGAKAVGGPQDDIKALRKENADLRERLRNTEELVRILRDFPAHRDPPASRSTHSGRGSKSRPLPPTRKKKRARPDRPETAPSDGESGLASDRTTPPAG
jgi:hypothetical protein